MSKLDPSVAVVYADESCLGNGREGKNPGGAASLIERWSGESVVREDLYISSPDTTNNRMALAGAIATLSALEVDSARSILFVSDSQYLIKGMNEWVLSWQARGWKRKGGKIENLELWQTLERTRALFQVTWRWVRGHADHPKNEYVNDLAIHAAESQITSEAMMPSGFDEWLQVKRSKGQFADYDTEMDLVNMEVELPRTK